jgi:anti-sigma B factor antagonist
VEEIMEITLREDANVTTLSLKGRLDLASGSALKEQIKQLFEKEKTAIHLNLGEVEFINSSGLGSLVSIMKEIRLRKGRLTLSNLASYVQEIFEITQLSHIFEIFATEEEAINSYQAVTAG